MKNEILIPGMGRLARMVPPGARFHKVGEHDLVPNQMIGKKMHIHGSSPLHAANQAVCLFKNDDTELLKKTAAKPLNYFTVESLGKDENNILGFLASQN